MHREEWVRTGLALSLQGRKQGRGGGGEGGEKEEEEDEGEEGEEGEESEESPAVSGHSHFLIMAFCMLS